MLFPSINFKEHGGDLEIIVKPGNYASNIGSLIFYALVLIGIDFFALWFYSNGAGAFPCFFTLGLFTIAYFAMVRMFTRELYREHIYITKDIFEITVKKIVGVKTVTRYKRGGMFDFRLGDQHVEGTLLFTYENETVRFCRMLHPEDAVEAYEKLLKYFNKSGHFSGTIDDNVIEVEPEEIF
jgi:hypothetical protein